MATSTTSGNSTRLPARGPGFPAAKLKVSPGGTYGATTGTTGTPGCRKVGPLLDRLCRQILALRRIRLRFGRQLWRPQRPLDIRPVYHYMDLGVGQQYHKSVSQLRGSGRQNYHAGGQELFSVSWIDSAGNFRLFGGEDVSGNVYNDFWAYQP